MKICFCAIALIACYAAALPSARSQAAILTVALQKMTAEDHLAKGRDAYRGKDYKIAEKELKRAIKLKKDLPEAHFLLAIIYRSKGKMKEAIRHAKEAIKYQSDFPEAHYLMARLLFENKDLAGAQQELNVALTQNPGHAPSHSLKGDLEITVKGDRSHKEQYTAALEAYEEALRLASPQDAGIPIMRQKVEALKSYIVFLSNKDDSAYERPIPLNMPRPNYTDIARDADIQGAIRIIVQVNEKGKVVDWIVVRGLGYGLDGEAIRAVRALRFSPATKDGVPVPYWQHIDVEFNLK